MLNDQWRPFKALYRDLNSKKPDITIYEEQDTSFFIDIHGSQSDSFAFISTGDHVTNQTFYLPRNQLFGKPKPITDRSQNHEYYVDHDGRQFVIRSNLRHQNFDLFTTDVDSQTTQLWAVSYTHLTLPTTPYV